jgi:glycerophosphoryl diester phosphodiesterase
MAGRERKLMEFFGHRGASAVAPENTLASLRLAAEQGVAGAEFDLQLTRDGVLVLLHDDTLRRTGVPIRRPGDESSSDFDSYEESLDLALSDVEWLAVKETVDVGSWKGARWEGERLATFGEALALLPEINSRGGPSGGGATKPFEYLVEMKRGDLDAVRVAAEMVRALDTVDAAKQLIFISFSLPIIVECRAAIACCRALHIIRGVDGETPAALRKRVDASLDAGATGIDFSANPTYVTAGLVAHVHARGGTVGVWTTEKLPQSDTPECWAAMVAAGVDFFTSNLPAELPAYEAARREAAAAAGEMV